MVKGEWGVDSKDAEEWEKMMKCEVMEPTKGGDDHQRRVQNLTSASFDPRSWPNEYAVQL